MSRQLKKGDTIKCHDSEDMIRTSTDLAKAGVMTDWPYIAENSMRKYTLVVTGTEKIRGPKCKTVYMLMDKNQDDLPLVVGNIHEVADYAGVTTNAILSAIRKAEIRGSHCRYAKVGFEEDLEGEDDED